MGLTVLKGEGGYSGEARDILFLMAERLQLSEIKNLVYQEDPNAFIAIENIHEVTSNNLKILRISRAHKIIKGVFV